MAECLVLIGVGLFGLVGVAVVVGWSVGSGWAVLAAAAGGFAGPALLVDLNYLNYARTHESGLGGLPYLVGLVLAIGLGLVAGVVSTITVGVRRREGPESVDMLRRVCLVGGSVAGLLLIGWWLVLIEWASDEMQNGLGMRALMPTLHFLAVLLAVGLGAVGGGVMLELTRAATRGPRSLVDSGIYLGALVGFLFLAKSGGPEAPRSERIVEWEAGVIGQDIHHHGEPSIRLAAATYRSTVPGLPAPPAGSVYLVLDVAMLTVRPVHVERFSAEADRGGPLQAVEVPQGLAIPAEPQARNHRQGNLGFLVPLDASAVTLRYTSEEGSWGIRWALPVPSASVEPPTRSPGRGSPSPTPIWTPVPTWVPPPSQLPSSTVGVKGGLSRHGNLIIHLDAVYQSAPPDLDTAPPGSSYLILVLDLRAATADATFRADRFRAETAEGTSLTPVAVATHQQLPRRGTVTYSGKPVHGRLAFLVSNGTEAVTVRYLDANGEGGIVWELPGPS